MKTLRRRLTLLISTVAILSAIGGVPSVAQATAASLTTEPATHVGLVSATLNASLYNDDKSSVGFQYGTTTAYGSNSSALQLEPEVGSYSIEVEGLAPETTYHYRAVGILWGEGVFYGEDRVFTTDSNGAYVTGVESEVPSEQPHFGATNIFGYTYSPFEWGHEEQQSEFTFLRAGGILATCGEFSKKWWAELPSTTLPVRGIGGWRDCELTGVPAKVDVNSCAIEYHVENAGPPYQGSVEITCTREGDAIEITPVDRDWTQFCSAEIPPQELGGSVTFSNELVETQARTDHNMIKVVTNATGLEFTASGSLCGGRYTGSKFGDGGVFFAG